MATLTVLSLPGADVRLSELPRSRVRTRFTECISGWRSQRRHEDAAKTTGCMWRRYKYGGGKKSPFHPARRKPAAPWNAYTRSRENRHERIERPFLAAVRVTHTLRVSVACPITFFFRPYVVCVRSVSVCPLSLPSISLSLSVAVR